jgi:uncharacterized protein (DUF1684 family)
MASVRFWWCLLLATVLLADPSYQESIQQWRQQREDRLKAEGGWLTLAGLIWLKEGANTVGSAPGSDILMSRGPEHLGVINYHAGKADFQPAPGIALKAMPLQSDENDAKPDILKYGDFSFFVIHRGTRDAIRLRDIHSDAVRSFTGLHWYPIRPEYHVTAKWVPYNPPKVLSIPNILGETEKQTGPGYAEFSLNGKQLRLEPVLENNQLFFIFKDQTAGKETYPPGRFLYAELPKDGTVVLDFNKAYTPPCAFTPYATCPLPPPQNRLPIRIEAGELNYGHH